jgi:hypothetical protein
MRRIDWALASAGVAPAPEVGEPDVLARVARQLEVGRREASSTISASVRKLGFPTVLELHQLNAFVLVTTNLLASGWGASYLLRKRYPGRVYAHVLAAGQALLIAQVALGLLLLSDGRRAPDELHYLYGTLALVAALAPWLYAPPVPARRLAWFVGATLFATALSVRAYTTA